MFRCGICDTVQPKRTVETSVVLETRVVQHPYRKKANWVPSKGEYTDDPGGRGTQIVRVARVGPCCAPKSNTQEAA